MPRCKETKPFTLCHPELVSGSRNSKAERTLLTRIYKFASSLINSTLSRKGRGEKVAFTLAEVLITLGIIGVVAAMTLPTLVANYQEKQTITQLEKTYSILSQAWQMIQNEYGSIETWDLKNTNTGNIDPETGNKIYDHTAQTLVAQRLKQYLNVAKTCKLNEVCDSRPSYTLSGQKLSDNMKITSEADSPPEANFILNDGTLVSIGWFTRSIGNISVTLPQGKQRILGKNRFFFEATINKLIPEGTYNTNRDSTFAAQCDPANTTTFAGRGCAAWVIYNKNMDYLHCREKLGWDKALSCKD